MGCSEVEKYRAREIVNSVPPSGKRVVEDFRAPQTNVIYFI